MVQPGLGLKIYRLNHLCIVGLGEAVGDMVGIVVGLTVGPTVGETVGDGDSVGVSVGDGETVGSAVGETVGETVGDVVRRGDAVWRGVAVADAVKDELKESFACAVVRKLKAGLDSQTKTAKLSKAANHGCFREFLFFILLPSFSFKFQAKCQFFRPVLGEILKKLIINPVYLG